LGVAFFVYTCYTENEQAPCLLSTISGEGLPMVAPNVVSVAVIVGIIALAEGLSQELPALGEPWVPFAVVALGALVKGLQIMLQDQRARTVYVAQSPGHRWRRWLVE